MEVYLQIGALMEKHGLTNQTMTNLTGIPLGTVSGIRSGKIQNPSFDNVCAMMKAMDESIDALVGITPPPVEVNEEKLTVDGYIGSDVKHHHSISIVNISEETKALARNAIREVYESEAYKNTQENLRVWRVVAIAEMVLIIGVLIFDITHPNMGYIQYSVTLEPIARSLIDWITRV